MRGMEPKAQRAGDRRRLHELHGHRIAEPVCRRSAGLFVELDETGADGFIPARYIGDEYFRFDEPSRAFVGRSATHRLGDPVTVELVEAAPVAGALRFKLVRDAAAAARKTGQPQRPQRTVERGSKSRGRRR